MSQYKRAEPPRLVDLVPSMTISTLSFRRELRWPLLNPSIATEGAGFRAIVRSVNYVLVDGRLNFLGSDNSFRTANYLVRLDYHMSLVSVEPLTQNSDADALGATDFEDCRLFSWRGSWWAVATARGCRPEYRAKVNADGYIVLLRLDKSEVREVVLIPGPSPARVEKNWMPFTLSDRLFLVYLCSPFIVYAWDHEERRLESVANVGLPAFLAGLQGSSQGVSVSCGQLFVVHQKLPLPRGDKYFHRFLLVDHKFNPTGVSEAFSFTGQDVEFCPGIARHGSDLLLSFGISDRKAAVARLPLQAVLDRLMPLGPDLRAGGRADDR